MKTTAVFLVVLLLVGLSGCTQTVPYRTYTNAQYGIALNPPEGWGIHENESGMVVSFSPLGRANVSLDISSPVMLDEGLALSTFADQVEELFPQVVQNFSVVYRDWRKIDGLNAYEIIYSYRENGSSMKALQVAVKKSKTVFLLTFTVPVDLYETYIEQVNQSIGTFM